MNRLLIGAALLAGVIAPCCRAADADDVKAAFAAFQAALKSGDPEKIWPLLDAKTQAAADKAAAALKKTYAKAKPAEKAVAEKNYGLSADDMANLTGKVYLKSKRFAGKYHEIPGSEFKGAAVEGDKAIVDYTEADGDKEKLTMVREDKKWKASVRVE